jgi:predicted phage replisome organizer
VMEEDGKRFYWLKLKRDFFKRHDMRIIESQENGSLYILFYLKLLVESLDHNGKLRFSDTIPYDEKMLATITGTNIDIVRTAIRIFADLGMMCLLDDGTYHLMQVEAMTGSESVWAEKKRNYRTNKDLKIDEDNVRTKKGLVRQENRVKSIDNSSSGKVKSHFVVPTTSEVAEYCNSRNNGIDSEAFHAHYEATGWMIGKAKMKNWKAAVITWEKRNREYGGDKKNVVDKKPFTPRLNPEVEAMKREREQND